jgi:hypothetical protein
VITVGLSGTGKSAETVTGGTVATAVVEEKPGHDGNGNGNGNGHKPTAKDAPIKPAAKADPAKTTTKPITPASKAASAKTPTTPDTKTKPTSPARPAATVPPPKK